MAEVVQVTLAALADTLETEESVWVRLAADRSERGWVLRLLEVTTTEPPPSWKVVTWAYPSARFLASRRRGEMVAAWLRKQRIVLRGATIPLSFHETAICERRESGWNGRNLEPLRWPHQEYRLTGGQNNPPTAELVSDKAPSFVSFDVALACLLDVPLAGWSISGREFVVRRQDRSGRITDVQVDDVALVADIEGERLAGAVVELAGNAPGPTKKLTGKSRQVRFPLPDGMPEGSWLLLRSGSAWLDRRYLTWPYARTPEPAVENVAYSPEPVIGLGALGSGTGELMASAQFFACSGLQAAADKNAAIFFLHAGIALEHLSKALLSSLHGSLIARSADFDSLLHLSGLSRHASTKPSQMRTITLQESVKRAAQIVPELGNLSASLSPLIDARSGVAHAALAQPEEVEALIVPFLRAGDLLLSGMGADRREYWGDLIDVVDARVNASTEKARISALEKMAVARSEFKQRVGDLADEAREALLHAIEAAYAPEKYEQTLVPCPACSTPALIEGTIDVDWEADWEFKDGEVYAVGAYPEVTIFPQTLDCRACGLRLRGEPELVAAGLQHSWKLRDIDPADFSVEVDEGWLDI